MGTLGSSTDLLTDTTIVSEILALMYFRACILKQSMYFTKAIRSQFNLYVWVRGRLLCASFLI